MRKLQNDETIKNRFTGIAVGLISNPRNEFFDHGFFVMAENDYVGYVKIGAYNDKEKCVYLRGAVDKDHRGQGLGSRMLSEVSDYIFKTYLEVENIKLKIARDNYASMGTANAAGFTWLCDDYFVKYNPYLDIGTPTFKA